MNADMTLKQTILIHQISGNIYILHGLRSGYEKLYLEGEEFEAYFPAYCWPLDNFIVIGEL